MDANSPECRAASSGTWEDLSPVGLNAPSYMRLSLRDDIRTRVQRHSRTIWREVVLEIVGRSCIYTFESKFGVKRVVS